MSFWGIIEHFTPDEFLCSCCGKEEMKESFIITLDRIRTQYGRPITITSGYRCSKHNQAISSTGAYGPHTTGYAADVAVHGAEAMFLINIAIRNGVSGLGINQKGDYSGRFLHLDTLSALVHKGPRPWVWTY